MLYPFSRYYPDYIKEAPDLVHPEEGKGLCQQRAYLFESIYRLINGEPPLKNLYDGEQYPERCIVGFGTPDTDFKSKESANTKGLVMFTRDLNDPLAQEQRGLIPLSKEAFRPCSIRVDSYQDGSSVLGTGVIIDDIHTPTNDLSLYCKDASDRGIIVLDTSNFVDMFKVYGLNANQTGQITFRSIYTDDGSTTRREGRFSVDGGATFVDAVAATGFINLGNPSVHKLDFTADSSGAFTFSAKALVDFAIVNCIEIYPS